VTDEGEEGGDRESFVAVASYFKINGMSVVVEGKEGDCGVNRNHEQDSDDTVE
jgi:uncharacterized Zn-binding protein involved in type VI secretion